MDIAWVNNYAFKGGQRRIEIYLVGIAWDYVVEQWKKNYYLNCKCKNTDGHDNVPTRQVEDVNKLFGRWLRRQKKSMKQGILNIEYVTRLDEIIVWYNSVK